MKEIIFRKHPLLKNNSNISIAMLYRPRSQNKVIFPVLPLIPGPRIKAEKKAFSTFGKVQIHHTLLALSSRPEYNLVFILLSLIHMFIGSENKSSTYPNIKNGTSVIKTWAYLNQAHLQKQPITEYTIVWLKGLLWHTI